MVHSHTMIPSQQPAPVNSSTIGFLLASYTTSSSFAQSSHSSFYPLAETLLGHAALAVGVQLRVVNGKHHGTSHGSISASFGRF
jgi:hypothetical protein